MNSLQVNSSRKFPEIKSNERFDFHIDLENRLNISIVLKSKRNDVTALSTLSRIERVIQNEKVMNRWSDLSLMFTTIVEKYAKKYESRCLLTRMFYKNDFLALKAKENLLKNVIEIRRNNIKSPPIFFPVVDDVIQHICSYLPYKTLANLSAVNRTAKKCVDVFFLNEAFRLNFKGEENCLLAKQYLKEVPYLINNLNEAGFISTDFIYFRNDGNMDSEKTLINWKDNQLLPCKDLKQLPVEQKHRLYPYIRWCLYGSESEVAHQVLLDCGIDPNLRDSDGNTMLHLANNQDVVSVLLKGGADINAKNHQGFSPLAMQLRNIPRHVDFGAIVRLLLQNGADPDYQNPVDGNTLYHYAIENCIFLGIPLSITKEICSLLSQFSSEGVDKRENLVGQTPDQLFEIAFEKNNEQ